LRNAEFACDCAHLKLVQVDDWEEVDSTVTVLGEIPYGGFRLVPSADHETTAEIREVVERRHPQSWADIRGRQVLSIEPHFTFSSSEQAGQCSLVRHGSIESFGDVRKID